MDIGQLHPAYLLIGSQETCKAEAIKLIAKVLGEKNYNLILQNKHAQVVWISPEKQYVLEDLRPVFYYLQFQLDANQHFFFVLENIDLLSVVCAQSLLKSLEEPPAGYHFILLGQKKEAVLPTIASRCLLLFQEESNNAQFLELLAYFTDKISSNNYQQVFAYLSKNNLDHFIFGFVDALYLYWFEKLKLSIKNNNQKEIKKINSIIDKINFLRNYIPLFGSPNFFLKNLYLQLKFSYI